MPLTGGCKDAMTDEKIFKRKKEAEAVSRELIAEQTGSDRAEPWHHLPERSFAAGFGQSRC